MTLLLVVMTFVELSDKNFIFLRQRAFVKQQAAAVLGLEMERDFWYLNNETLAKLGLKLRASCKPRSLAVIQMHMHLNLSCSAKKVQIYPVQ